MVLDSATQAHYRAVANWIAMRVRAGEAAASGTGLASCPVIGINGAQGSGKSTASRFIQEHLAAAEGLRSAVMSLDDFYLPRASRLALSTEVHSLLATRGVPGTHDVLLGIELLDRLRQLREGESLWMPRFSKADDDRAPVEHGNVIAEPVDVVLFEGWCVGTPPQALSELAEPVNALEADEDADGRWRRWVNQRLASDYARWFSRLDAIVFLQVPDFDCVHRWRWQQEQDTARLASAAGAALLSRQAIGRFIQYYQRLSLHALRVMPAIADVRVILRDDHAVASIDFSRTSPDAAP